MRARKWVGLVFLGYLRLAARLQIAKNWGARVVGITGSSGKTSLREALGVMLASEYRVKVCSQGNSETGIPLDILGLEVRDYSVWDWLRVAVSVPMKLVVNWERYELMVVEMAVDSPFPPKNMKYLLSIVRPSVGVFLNVSTVHGEAFDKLLGVFGKGESEELVRRLIAEEKGRMIEALPGGGLAVLNVDEPLVAEFANKTGARVVGFGKSENAEVRVKEVRVCLRGGFELAVEVGGEECRVKFGNEVLGLQYGMMLAAALGVAWGLGMDIERAVKALERGFRLPPGRMSLLRGIKGSYIVDSSYNASKLAMLGVIQTCEGLKAPLKIAVLGDMREVGKSAVGVHREVARRAMEVFDRVIFVGEIFETSLKGSGLSEKSRGGRVRDWSFYRCSLDAVGEVKKYLGKDVLLLVKGSQNRIFLEALVEKLLADPGDRGKLCRRGEYWERVRGEWFEECGREN